MSGKNGLTSRRRPWPYDMYLGNNLPVILVPDAANNLLGQKTQTLDQSAPITFEYGSANPFKERTFLWTKLYAGFGQAVAPSDRPRRYLQATKADLSINGYWMKGPNFEDHVETVNAGAGEVRQFIQALHGGVLVTWAICENGVFRRTSDGTWVASLTLGLGGTALSAGQFPQQAVRFKGRYASNVDGLYVTTAAGGIYQYTGAAWVTPVSTAGPGDGTSASEARYIEKVGDELWVAGDYWVAKCEADPLLRISWPAVIWIGDQTAKITWLKQIEDTLIIFKEDGIYTLSTSGTDQELFAYLRLRKSITNGRNAAAWLGRMWVPFGGQTFTLTADGTLTPDGPEQFLENGSNIKGSMVAGAGHNTWFFYELYYDGAGHTNLVKHGTWIDEGTDQVDLKFIDAAHHGSLYDWEKEGTSTEVLSGIDASGNDRLYVGFADGTLAWCILPAISPNPALDSNCEFTTEDSYVYLPIHHSNFQADSKLYRGISSFGLHLTTTEWVEVSYRTDVSDQIAAWTDISPDNPKFTIPGQRLNFPQDNPVFSKAILFRVKLVKDPDPAASPAHLTPIIEGLSIHEQIRPSISLEYTATVLCSSFLPKHNGTIDRRRGIAIKDAILALCAGPGTVLVTMPDGVPQELTITDYHEALTPRRKRSGLEYTVSLTMIQLATITQGTTTTGLTYSTLEQYTHGELEALL